MRAQSSVGTAEWTTLIEAINIGGGELRKRPRIRSGGLPYRAANATALIGEPDLNILNDPLSAQDPMPVAARMDLPACSLDRRQAAKMLIPNDLGPAARRLATGMVMQDARIMERGATSRILEQPKAAVARALAIHRNWMVMPCRAAIK